MRNSFLLLALAFLFSVNIFASNSIEVADRDPFRALDLTGPVISYTPLAQSSCTISRTLSAVITDIDGVNTSIGTKPRIYYKRNGDGNVWNNNTTATDGWKYVEATNTTSPFNFVMNYSLLFGGAGVTLGQSIQYFVVAQDLAATANVSINSGSFNTAPASVGLSGSAFPIGAVINSFVIVTDLGPLINIGTTGDFFNLTTSSGLFRTINSIGLSGNTVVEIIDPLITENSLYGLNQIQNTGCNAGAVSLIIKPKAGVISTITGSVDYNPLIRIYSNNVTIDGSNNGTASRNLTIQNTSVNGSNVILYGSLSSTPITNSTLKNTNCINGANETANIVISDASLGGGPGYFNNIRIQNNSIQKGLVGVLAVAVANTGNGSLQITGNDINTTGANQVGLVGVYTEGVDGATISNNNIGNFEPANPAPRYGIWLIAGTKNTTISGNTISGINYSGSTVQPVYGIYLAPGISGSNNIITGNTITNITSGGAATAFGIGVSSASGGVTIQKNNISNIKNTNASGYGTYGIGLSSTLTAAGITVANNFICDVAGRGSSTTPNVRNGFGIYMGAGGGYKIYNNSISMNANQINASGVSAALMINGVTTASSIDLRNNILTNLQFAGVPVAGRYSIYSANANSIFSNIDNNDYYSTGTYIGYLGGIRTTLTDIIAGFGGNANSLNLLPDFTSLPDLHLKASPLNCPLDNKGTPIAGYADDIDNQDRSSSIPDLGADEFTAHSGSLAGVVGTAVCVNKALVTSGTEYTQSSNCDLIATVIPSGGAPVSGMLNACVTLDAAQQYFNSEPYVKRHYDLEPAVSNQTTTSATITLYFTDAEFLNYNGLNPVWPPLPTVANGGNIDPNKANVRITQFHGTPTGGLPTTWPGNYTGSRVLINPGASNVYWNGNYWEVTFNVAGFSGFYLHSTISNLPLPISVNYFTGVRQNNNHILNWKVTCNSTPRVTITLERSADGRSYEGINTLTADALRCNQPFDYTDISPLKGMNYYRLKMTDDNGKVTYSTTVALLNAVKGFTIVSIAPNPVAINGDFRLNMASAQSSKMQISIIDMRARVVNTQTVSVAAGSNSIPMNVSNLSAGTYFLYGIVAGEKSAIIKFVKQ